MPHTDPSTLMIHGVPEQIMPGALHPQWVEAARAKGFELVARVRNRYNLALRCKTCGELVRKAVYVLMTSDRPLCAHCLENAWAKTAEAAGLRLLRRDPGTTQYAFYLAPCGHEIRRQFEFVRRIARGEVKHRCEICHAAREAAEAAARDWELMSADPEGDRGYRLYRHSSCGTEARIARANMQTGRFTCPGCGESWATAPSHLYAMRFEIAPGKSVVKLGYSRDPRSRLDHQLPRDKDLPRQLLCSVPVRSGTRALRLERKLHKQLKAAHPGAVVPTAAYAGALKVKSEIYRPEFEQPILRALRRVAREEVRAAKGTATDPRPRRPPHHPPRRKRQR